MKPFDSFLSREKGKMMMMLRPLWLPYQLWNILGILYVSDQLNSMLVIHDFNQFIMPVKCIHINVDLGTP